MSVKHDRQRHLYKAAMYQKYAEYYKYRNPSLHIYYYLNHLKYINKTTKNKRTDSSYSGSDLNFPSNFRILHSAPNQKSVDIAIDGRKLLNNMAYKDCNDYVSLTTGKHQMEIFYSEENRCMIKNQVYFSPGKFYTFILTEENHHPKLIAFEDSPFVPVGEAKIRFIHLSSNNQSLDIAVKNRDVIFSNLQHLKSTSYLGITPMTLQLEARKAKNGEIAMNFPVLKLEANTTYTAIISNDDVILLREKL